MAKCEQCVPESVRKYSGKTYSPVACSECGQKPAYWWQPKNGQIDFT